MRLRPDSRRNLRGRLFHDENGNGKMDTGFLGIPTEGVVVSNQAKGFMGPPKIQRREVRIRGRSDGAAAEDGVLTKPPVSEPPRRARGKSCSARHREDVLEISSTQTRWPDAPLTRVQVLK